MTSDIGTLTFSAAPRDYDDLSNPGRKLFVNVLLGETFFPADSTAYVTGEAWINGTKTDWHMGKIMPAGYSFHSTLGRYQNKWDAFWTDHYLHSGDTVEFKFRAYGVTEEDGRFMQAEYDTTIVVE